MDLIVFAFVIAVFFIYIHRLSRKVKKKDAELAETKDTLKKCIAENINLKKR
jgi:preprotein translocase subunit YajC